MVHHLHFVVIQIVCNQPFRSIFLWYDLEPTSHFVPDELFQINRVRGQAVFVHHCSHPLCAFASVPSAELGVPNDGVLLVVRLEHPLQPLTRVGFFQLYRGELNAPTSNQWEWFRCFFPFGFRYAVDDSHSVIPP
jgi:hypothetical protein